MTAKRFNYHYDGFGAYYLCDKEEGVYEDGIIGEIWADKSDMINLVNLLNRLSDENEQLKKDRFICLDCKHSGYIEIGCLCEYNDCWQEYINECEDFTELEE